MKLATVLLLLAGLLPAAMLSGCTVVPYGEPAVVISPPSVIIGPGREAHEYRKRRHGDDDDDD